jgi:uncharacterized lipoprotein YehR (DUF1307 family)
MKQLLLICAAVALVGCGKDKDSKQYAPADFNKDGIVTLTESKKFQRLARTREANQTVTAAKKPLTKEESAKVIEAAIRDRIKKPTGELTKADLEKVTKLYLVDDQLTDVKGLEKLTQLTWLILDDNQLTDVKGLEKLTKLETLWLGDNKLTDVKGLEKLTQLTWLELQDNPDLTGAQIDELQKALPKCTIRSDFE